MANFNDSAVDDMFGRLLSHAMNLGYFERVNQHEPRNKPPHGLTAALWNQRLGPIRTSGLASVSGRVVFNLRVYQNFQSQPLDAIDPTTIKAVNALLAAYSGDFDLGATVRAIDIFGMEGIPMESNAGYVEIDRTIYRVVTITIPVLVNDMWVEAG